MALGLSFELIRIAEDAGVFLWQNATMLRMDYDLEASSRRCFFANLLVIGGTPNGAARYEYPPVDPRLILTRL